MFPFIPVVVGALPLLATAMLAWFATQWRRWVAVVLVVPVGGIYAFELYSGWVGGNLTGLIWMFTTPVVVLILVALSVFELASRRAARSDSGGDGMGGISKTDAATDGGE